jgi:hypothetical protein
MSASETRPATRGEAAHRHGLSLCCADCFPGFSPTRRQLLMTAAASLMPGLALAQQKLQFDVKSSCSFYPGDKITDAIYNFQSSEEALTIVKRITGAVGLEPNFELLQANIPNAAAVVYQQKRYILYSLLFIEKIREVTATDWAALTIMAHEVGHHLNGHTLGDSGSRPTLELQADKFAGHTVKRVGGTLDQALAAYQIMSAEGTETHPPRSARLEAVTRGWIDASAAATASVPDTPPGAAGKDSDAVAKEILDAIRSGSTPASRMSPTLTATMKDEGDKSFAKLRIAGASATVRQQGKHLSSDGNLYYLYDIRSGVDKLSCVMGIDKAGFLNVFHCQ